MKPKNYDINYKAWKQEIPVPVYDEHPEYLDFYWKAWELAHDHITPVEGMPQNPYMDEAFLNTDIWIWDTCFMMFFCKYAPNIFPGIESLNNFYKPLHDGAPLPKVICNAPPEWTGFKNGELAQLRIHIPDNPPLFAWAEYSYALMTGDKAHLEDLLLNTQYLQKHFAFFDSFTELGYVTEYTRAPSCLLKHEHGYFWEGGRSGMDNTPRGRTGERAEADRPNNPRMLWVDALAQQGLSALFIAKIAKLIGQEQLAAEWMEKYNNLKEKMNRYYWDPVDGAYYDVHADTMEVMRCLTPASFWPMLAEMASTDQADQMAAKVQDPNKLGGVVPWVTLARDDADFNAETGNYWRGSVWLPTAYMGIKSLETYGKFNLAHDTACKVLSHMFKTYQEYEPHTVWECYSPVKALPARHKETRVRPDFCGWSALGPLALFLENVIGIYKADAFENKVYWALPEQIVGKLGIRNYSFGDVVTDLVYENGFLNTVSNQPYTLLINGLEIAVPAGEQKIKL